MMKYWTLTLKAIHTDVFWGLAISGFFSFFYITLLPLAGSVNEMLLNEVC